MRNIISDVYNEKIESFCTRVLYFFNTIDSYFFIAGAISFFLLSFSSFDPVSFLFVTAAIFILFKTADFYPLFVVLSPLYLYFLISAKGLGLEQILSVLMVNIMIYFLIQFVFMSVPEMIVSRDLTVGFRKIWNSLFTVAPTTVSFSMSVFFSTLYSLALIANKNFSLREGIPFWLVLFFAAVITYFFKPKTFISCEFKPLIKRAVAKRVIVLNIDGCRLDRFIEAKLPFLSQLQEKSTYFPEGIETVYRALTNPAFASILTGATPLIHGIKNNNLGQKIKVEGLPDIVKTKLYGSMHVKHFSKSHWQTNVVSLPRHSVYKSDDIMLDLLYEDLLKKDQTALFVADISETDFIGHAYGSESKQYLAALKRADSRIDKFFQFLKRYELEKTTVVIICSDHGMVRIDHSYLISRAEKYVPFIITGPGVKKNNPLHFRASIMDIALTISYILGVKYPEKSKGRVFIEAFV
ncbi:MAG: alkaline phosphatase family protein [Candidatus Omnitrophica bacterium]|nr:alkaline phosphatase family protein [Candidatus Omnitrophota bacterium]